MTFLCNAKNHYLKEVFGSNKHNRHFIAQHKLYYQLFFKKLALPYNGACIKTVQCKEIFLQLLHILSKISIFAATNYTIILLTTKKAKFQYVKSL